MKRRCSRRSSRKSASNAYRCSKCCKRQPKEILLTALLRMPEQAPGYVFGAFIFTYGTDVLGQSRDFLLFGVIVSTVLGFLWVTCAGRLSDRVGRKKMSMSGCVIMGDFRLRLLRDARHIDTDGDLHRGRHLTGSGHDLYGPEAALIAEVVLATASLQWRVAWLSACLDHCGRPGAVHRDGAVRRYHSSLPIAIYILDCAVIGLVATALLTDYTNKEISAEYETFEWGDRAVAAPARLFYYAAVALPGLGAEVTAGMRGGASRARHARQGVEAGQRRGSQRGSSC